MKVETSRYHAEVQNIAQSALTISIFIFLSLIGFVVLLIEIVVFQLQDFPDSTPVEMTSRFVSVFLSLALVSIAHYLHQIARKKIQSSMQQKRTVAKEIQTPTYNSKPNSMKSAAFGNTERSQDLTTAGY